MILKLLVIFLLLTGTASASYWVGDKEVGLAAYQNSGDVGGTHIMRDPLSDIHNIYIETESQDILWQQFWYNPQGFQINPTTKHIKRVKGAL